MDTRHVRPASVALVVGLIAAGLANAGGISAKGDDSDIAEYAQDFGKSIEEANEIQALIDQARHLQSHFELNYPTEFAGLWVEHLPEFRVVLALTSTRAAEATRVAGPTLSRYLELRSHRYSLESLHGIIDSIPRDPRIHALGIDAKANTVHVDTIGPEVDDVTDALAGLVSDGSVRVDVTSPWEPVDPIYGGLNADAGACGGLQGTFGWSVTEDGTGTPGIVTAGHLTNCLRYSGVNLTFEGESNSGISDSQWHTTLFVDEPKFRWREDGAVRIVTAKRSYKNVLIGEIVCKMGRATGYECGTVSEKDVDPDGWGPFSAKFIIVEDCSGADQDDLADEGDSGGPVFFGLTAYGIVTHQGADQSCSNLMAFNSLTQVQNALGVTLMLGE